MASLILLLPSSLFATLFEAYVWKKYIPQTKQMQRLYCFSDVHHESVIARKQVNAMLNANAWLNNHGHSMVIISEFDDDFSKNLRANPLKLYDEQTKPCLNCDCPVDFFDYLAVWPNEFFLVPIDFRNVSAFTSNFFNWFIASRSTELSENEMLNLFGLEKLSMVVDKDTRYTTLFNVCNLTVQNLFQEYCRIFSEINNYPERNMEPFQQIYNAIVHEVAENATIIFEPYYRSGYKNESIYTYVMRNTSQEQRELWLHGYNGDSILHYLDKTCWC